MKKLLLILLCLPMIGFGQNSLFSLDLSNSVVATKDPTRTIGLEINAIQYEKIISEAPKSFQLDLPFFNQNISLFLESFEVHSTDLKVMAKTLDGTSELNVIPTILSYKIMLNDNSIGVMNFFNGKINATFKVNNQQFEIVDYNNNYILFETSNSINSSNFSCGVESQFNSISTPQNPGAISNQVCIELALEIDYFTKQTFNSDAEATNWALAILAGVDQLYQAQTNVSVSIVGVYIWQVTDPYAAFVNDFSNMLFALKDNWLSTGTSINRDLVHLLTRRSGVSTGTGGVAYLDALCNNNWGYGFSSDMNTDTTYSFPNPTYTWNLAVVTHEIAHNIGANHTFWCGWLADPSIGFNPQGGSGAVSNCVDVDGNCTNNPAPGVGTIMSYCHSVAGGSLILEFHDVIVSQALDPGITVASCLTACQSYGCTYPTACNYDPAATIDDSSCNFPDGCMDPLACNYDVTANCDDGSCVYVYGCTDINACNYDPTAMCDDGSCTGFSGCMDSTNCNYDPTATCELNNPWDNRCLPNGCIDSSACNYDPLAGCDDGTCIIPDGCTDEHACNYDPTATCDDGSCTGFSGCMDSTNCNYDPTATCDNNVDCAPMGCMNATACNYDPIATCDDGSCLTDYGCIDASAFNYDPIATCDDGSCIAVVDGCTDSTACNYDALVNTDDGSCYNLLSSIGQNGDTLIAITTPIGLTADWYNIQTDSTTRIWLMDEDVSSFSPTFDCSYFIVVSDNGCIDTSAIYYYGENAARIGSFTTSPNPTSGLINVKFENSKNQFVMFELISNSGSKLDEFITIENNLDIDLSKYPSGSYYLYFNSEDAVQGCRLEEVQKVSTKIILIK